MGILNALGSGLAFLSASETVSGLVIAKGLGHMRRGQERDTIHGKEVAESQRFQFFL